MRAQIEAAFGRRSVQCCGGCEFARYGAACPEDPDHLHLAETHCHLEVLRADGAPCAPGELGNVIVTSLHSRALPVLRLEPGDVGRLIEEPCACGRTSRRLQHEGRVQAMLRGVDGRWIGEREVWDALLALEGVALFQLRQVDAAEFDLDLLSAPHLALDEGEVRDRLAGLLGAHVRVRVRHVAGIAPESSGKLQLVKSRCFEDFRIASARREGVPVN
jgi:phenylacetate-coenzyme A ligase PaaK-like adenylate-forming protein